MEKSNLDLFRQAINEGLSNRFDNVANSYTEKIICSEKHNLAMRTIIYGKADRQRVWSPRIKCIIAILVAAAILLTSCGVIFRNEIREVFEKFFVNLTYSSDDTSGSTIEKIYELSYLPEGYYLTENTVTDVSVMYIFLDTSGNSLYFEQHILDGSYFLIDSESGYSKVVEIQGYEVYHKSTKKYFTYLLNDGKYSLVLKSTVELSNEELVLIIKGIKIK